MADLKFKMDSNRLMERVGMQMPWDSGGDCGWEVAEAMTYYVAGVMLNTPTAKRPTMNIDIKVMVSGEYGPADMRIWAIQENLIVKCEFNKELADRNMWVAEETRFSVAVDPVITDSLIFLRAKGLTQDVDPAEEMRDLYALAGKRAMRKWRARCEESE